ncbi:alpha-galactosidase [Candidatus Planktophila vernalis]|uniref:alpha-galactosidase n=1 Tax=Candidatus Planktophila vernalis TaxID=1884907 RepID=UPI000BACD02A|nr:alpha-galactosidase [Candidatus Planktophila vernalis]
MTKQTALLSAPTSSLLIEVVNGALVIRHWGAPILGQNHDIALASRVSIANSSWDEPQLPGLMRESARGFLGRPSLSGHRNGKAWSTKFEVTDFHHQGNHCAVTLRDFHAELEVIVTFDLDAFGVLIQKATVKNIGNSDYVLNEFIHWLPLPREATQNLDFAGRWSNERQPQCRDIQIGTWVRESREGRSGHNFSIADIALTAQTSFQSGSAWATSIAWSGNSHYLVERGFDGQQSIGAGELLLAGEVILKGNESYEAPALFAVYSSQGLDGVSAAFHSHLRAREIHPKRPRPLTLNMWEALYFDHNESKIRELVDVAAEVGVERVVLDDGWFHSRRNDRSGLGDWVVDPAVWPNGLTPVVEYINSKGIEFGLWFEGEMVNPDSDLYRAHPEWILHEGDRTPPLWRHQLVLDLGHEEAYKHVLEQTSSLLAAHNIVYIKWDHNRVLVDAGHLGVAGVRRQTQAIYRLFAELKKRHPGLEIESCASGGARIDLGVIDYVDRFWTSDNNDALERQTIQRWTSQVIPPEMLGTHIGPTHGHQTGRTLELSMRAITALFGHAGIEWNITQATAEERANLATWAKYYKDNRALLHSGKSVRIDYPDEHGYLYGVISADTKKSIFAYVQLTPTVTIHPASLKFAGLDAAANYLVKAVYPAGKPRFMLITPPQWMDGITMSGSALATIGVSAPILAPANAVLIEITKL